MRAPSQHRASKCGRPLPASVTAPPAAVTQRPRRCMHSGGPTPIMASPGRGALLTAMISASEPLDGQPGMAVAVLILKLSCSFCRGKGGGYTKGWSPSPPSRPGGSQAPPGSSSPDSECPPAASVPWAGRPASTRQGMGGGTGPLLPLGGGKG